MVSMTLGLPTPEQEMEILQRAEHGLPKVNPLLTPAEVVQMQEVVMGVKVATSVRQYIVNLAGASRQCGYLAVGVSPRGSASLLRACQGWAAFQGRSFVIPEDVQELAPHVWGQRVLVNPEEGTQSGREAIGRLLKSVPVPL
jgi:MoxR-like ATPase